MDGKWLCPVLVLGISRNGFHFSFDAVDQLRVHLLWSNPLDKNFVNMRLTVESVANGGDCRC